MKKSKIMVYNITELRETLKKFYSDILKDTANNVVQDGHCIVPSQIMVTGVDNLYVEDLVTAAEEWAEMQVDISPDDIDAIIMTDGMGHNYLLTPNLVIDIQENDSPNPCPTQPKITKKKFKNNP